MQQTRRPALAHYGLGNGEAPPNSGAGLTDWAVPWSDVMMCLCVGFVVLFVYASTHKDVTILFQPQETPAARVLPSGGSEALVERLADSRLLLSAVTRPGAADGREVLYRSGDNGVTVIREPNGDMRLTLRGDIFFGQGQGTLNPQAAAYLKELDDILRVNEGLVHVIGFADEGEGEGAAGFDLSQKRALSVTRHFWTFRTWTRGGFTSAAGQLPARGARHRGGQRRAQPPGGDSVVNGSETQGGQP